MSLILRYYKRAALEAALMRFRRGTDKLVGHACHLPLSWLALLLLSQAVPALSQTRADWQAGLGNWSVASNWNCGVGFPNGCVPTSQEVVGISNGGSVNVNINATSQQLFVDSGSS